jgi:hypothetical protein
MKIARVPFLALAAAVTLPGLVPPAAANTLDQNVSWTIDRQGTSAKYRLVAYGDSIYAGYIGSITYVAKYAAPTVDAEYLSALWDADIESVRRAKSGALAEDVFYSKIVGEMSYMQDSSTRVVTFEMCGNDGLQARTAFRSQTGTCDYSGMETAVSNCKTYVSAAMDFINANAYPGAKVKVVSNLYYPGYDADNVQSSCTDPSSGTTVNLQDVFLSRLATMNYWMCEYAREKAFVCADNFAQYMGSDYDSNGDGRKDSAALAWVAGESESDYVTRITTTLRSTIRDANAHFVSADRSYDYIQSDDIHPTYSGGTVKSGIFGDTKGSGPPRQKSYKNGKSTIWNQYGHERMGWAVSTFNTPGPNAAAAVAQMPAIAAAPQTRAAPPTRPVSSSPPASYADLAPELRDDVDAGNVPAMSEVLGALHRSGIHGGLAAFSPPGTRPPLIGLAVPEDFELPPGFVRYYQATDDGQRIEAILMFSPDRPFIDAQGRPVAIPKDRVVPPELAPPGLPLRRIVIPAPIDTTGR